MQQPAYMYGRVETRRQLLKASSIQIEAVGHEAGMQPACFATIAEGAATVHKVHLLPGACKLLQVMVDAGDNWREPAASK